ncbi:TIGR04206 family protein [Halococcus saccharolyticus]|uniref:DUF8050 domain-containing protein n=1 Tax=Halococcus saccharolyticus DSM 5350 TaxID=1227455 RepID=M0MKC9_9EURY|nr:TIGR04206 family protein [Halococcus saccharolyticus]EMA45194.1 hypothetical protein C449_07902 [Halococcus saccharolyticus DSM 5350]
MAGVSAPPGSSTPRRRLLVLLALGLVPWTVLVGSEVTLLFPFGLVNANPLHLTPLNDYLRFARGFAALPRYLQAWPVSVGCYLAGLASALVGVVWREDPRVTGGLIALAGLSHVSVAVGLSRGIGRLALPIGPVLALAVAWWFYWPAVRRG